MLPTGTVTFLMTDIEGSTPCLGAAPRRWRPRCRGTTRSSTRRSRRMAECVRWSKARVTASWRAFSRASDAVAAAVTAQRCSAAEQWPEGCRLAVRMAVHTGEAQLRDEGNYFGSAVIRCARLRSCGHGGQVLMSDVTAALVADRLPDGDGAGSISVCTGSRTWAVRNGCGSWCTRICAAEFPPLLSLDAFRHNLPVQLSPLIGRRREIAEVVGADRVRAAGDADGGGRRRQDPVGLGRGRRGGRRRSPAACGSWSCAGRAARASVGRATLKALGAHGDARRRAGRGRGGGARRRRAVVGDPGQLRAPGRGVRRVRRPRCCSAARR